MSMRRYAEDYETVITTDEKGNEKKTAVYRGDYFEFSLDAEGILRFRRTCVGLLAAIVIFHISGGFVGNRGMNQLYVALPYVIAFFPLIYMVMGVFRLPKEQRKYRRDEIGLSFESMKTASIVMLIFIGIGVLGEIIFLLFVSDGDQLLLEVLYLALETLAVSAVFYFIFSQRKVRILTCSK